MALRYFSAKPLCPSHQRRGVGQGASEISSSSSRPPFTGWITQGIVSPPAFFSSRRGGWQGQKHNNTVFFFFMSLFFIVWELWFVGGAAPVSAGRLPGGLFCGGIWLFRLREEGVLEAPRRP